MSYHNTPSSQQSTTNTQGQTAPAGYHYMPDGSLMLDTEHDKLYGEGNIRFNLDTSDIKFNGETRRFSVSGDDGAVFSIEIYDDAAGSPTLPRNYYNFTTNTWSSTKSRLSNVQLTGDYRFSVVFPSIEFTDATCAWNSGTDSTITHTGDDGKIVAGMTVTGPSTIPANSFVKSVTSDTVFELGDALGGTDVDPTGGAATSQTLTFAGIRKYTIDIHAETVGNISTKHAPYTEVRNPDDTVNLNKSTGSNSNLLRKIIYQDVKKNLYLSCIAPSLTNASTDVNLANLSGGGSRILTTVANPLDKIAIGDKVTGTGALTGSHILVTAIDPDNDDPNEISVNQSVTMSAGGTLTYTPVFNSMTPNGTDETTGRQAFEVSSGENLKRSFSITCTAPVGRTLSASRLPTTKDLCAYTTVTFESAALALEGEDTASATKFFRWPIINIAKLKEGMVLDPGRTDGDGSKGVNTTTPAKISKYSTTKTILESTERKYHTDVSEITIEDVSVGGVDSYGYGVTAVDRNGIITAQKGNIIFDVQQLDILKADTDVRIFAYGAQKIKSLTGINVAISDIVITPTQISTTTTGAVSNSVTIPVTSTDHISTTSTIRGIGINASVANPTVSFKATATGGANLTASAAQTLESGQTLYFDGNSNILTITGIIEVSSMDISDTTLYFDVEKFIDVN